MVRLEAPEMGALAEYGSADVYVYRVKQPLAFLKRQKNLRRIDTAATMQVRVVERLPPHLGQLVDRVAQDLARALLRRCAPGGQRGPRDPHHPQAGDVPSLPGLSLLKRR